MYTIASDLETGVYIVMYDGIDVEIFYSLEDAQNFVDNAN
jgi:hypothetical protein